MTPGPARREWPWLHLVLLGLGALYLVGLFRGLPATEGWDDDGVAPRDFLTGLASSFTPGDFHTYPPFHLLLLALLTAPIWVAAVLRSPSLGPADLVATFLQPGTMTALAVVARLASLLLALLCVWALSRVAAELWGERAGLFAALLCGLDGVLTYYAHCTNLDVPSLCWSALSLLGVTRAIVRGEPRRLRWAAVFAALAVASKDQVAGLFLLSLPALLGAWLWLERDQPRREGQASLLREAAWSALVAIGLLLLLDGAVTNPRGFAARLRFLTGPASADYAEVPPGLAHLPDLLSLALGRLADFAPPTVWALVPFGLALGGRIEQSEPALSRLLESGSVRRARLAAWLPLAAALSFTLTFVAGARRSEHRFWLPQLLLLTLYAAPALDWLWCARLWSSRWRLGRPLAAGVLLSALLPAARVDIALLLDPRADAEQYLAAHARAGETVETYGGSVYLPRFPVADGAGYGSGPPRLRVVRVDAERPVASRSRLPGVEELLAAPAEASTRAPDWIVAPRAWTGLWLDQPGRTFVPAVHRGHRGDGATRAYFEALRRGTLPGWELVHTARCPEVLGRGPRIHNSTCAEVDLLRRRAAQGPAR